MEERNKIINSLCRRGNLLNVLGILRCVSNINETYSLTKTEYTHIILQNYLQSELTENLQKEIEKVWEEAKDTLDYLGCLQSYSDTELTIYPPNEYSHTRNTLFELRKNIKYMKEKIDKITSELPILEQEYKNSLNQCATLGHLPHFHDQTKCRICDQKIILQKEN